MMDAQMSGVDSALKMPEGEIASLTPEGADRLRSRAERVLADLEAARSECRRHLAKLNKADAMEAVTGQSSIDRAIEATQRLLRKLNAMSAARSASAAL